MAVLMSNDPLELRARDMAGNVGSWSEARRVTEGNAFQLLPLGSAW